METDVVPAEPATQPLARSAPRSGTHGGPAVLAGASALLLWAAFPPADLGWLGWGALVPFLSLVRSDLRPARVYGASWTGGLLFGAASTFWVSYADAVGWLFLALFMSVWWPLFLLPARLAVRRLGLPLMLVAPMVWVGLEFLRAHILSGFPWFYLAHTQHAYLPVIQVCDLLGAWGLSFLMVMANVLWLDLLTLPLMTPTTTGSRLARAAKGKIAVVGGLVVLSLVYGGFRLAGSSFRAGPRVALLQSDFPQDLKNGIRSGEMLARLRRLLDRAIAAEPKPDLVVWPETSYAPGFVTIDPELPESDFARQARQYHQESTPEEWRSRQARSDMTLRIVVEDAGIPMVVGAPSYEFAKRGLLRRNSAALIEDSAAPGPVYHKQALVPMGEYIPFLETLPWLLALTPYTDGYVPSLTHGEGSIRMASRGVSYAPTICFEDTIPHLVRRAALPAPDGSRPDVLLNLTNDGWFRGSAEHRAHLAISAIRAVECRRPLIRAVNTGISAIIDGNGRVLQTLPVAREDVLIGTVPLDGRSSLYLVVGDMLGVVCLGAIGLILIASLVRPRHPSPFARGDSMG